MQAREGSFCIPELVIAPLHRLQKILTRVHIFYIIRSEVMEMGKQGMILPDRNKYFGIGGLGVGARYDLKDKEYNARMHSAYMLARTNKMFVYKNLPEHIPARDHEMQLQCNGYTGIIDVRGSLYSVWGTLGGEYNEDYMPTKFIVANPALDISKEYTIHEDCVIIPNDTCYLGMLPLYNRFASMLAENELTIHRADVNLRAPVLISAGDDNTKQAADEYFRKLEAGDIGAVAENAFLDGIRSQPYSSGNSVGYITQLIELEQYIWGQWCNSVGLSEQFNMKREALNSSESALGVDTRRALIDDLRISRQDGWNEANDLFGTSVEVDLSETWQVARDESVGDPEEYPAEPEESAEEGGSDDGKEN